MPRLSYHEVIPHIHMEAYLPFNMVYIRSSRNKGTQLAMQVHLITVIKR